MTPDEKAGKMRKGDGNVMGSHHNSVCTKERADVQSVKRLSKLEICCTQANLAKWPGLMLIQISYQLCAERQPSLPLMTIPIRAKKENLHKYMYIGKWLHECYVERCGPQFNWECLLSETLNFTTCK